MVIKMSLGGSYSTRFIAAVVHKAIEAVLRSLRLRAFVVTEGTLINLLHAWELPISRHLKPRSEMDALFVSQDPDPNQCDRTLSKLFVIKSIANYIKLKPLYTVYFYFKLSVILI